MIKRISAFKRLFSDSNSYITRAYNDAAPPCDSSASDTAYDIILFVYRVSLFCSNNLLITLTAASVLIFIAFYAKRKV